MASLKAVMAARSALMKAFPDASEEELRERLLQAVYQDCVESGDVTVSYAEWRAAKAFRNGGKNDQTN